MLGFYISAFVHVSVQRRTTVSLVGVRLFGDGWLACPGLHLTRRPEPIDDASKQIDPRRNVEYDSPLFSRLQANNRCRSIN